MSDAEAEAASLADPDAAPVTQGSNRMALVKRLRLSLNLGFHEIDDPKGLCVDVTNVGRWGNGDVEVGLSTPEQLPYVMGLIRQAFDHQMGNQADS